MYLVALFGLLLVSSPFLQPILESFTSLGALHLYMVSMHLQFLVQSGPASGQWGEGLSVSPEQEWVLCIFHTI